MRVLELRCDLDLSLEPLAVHARGKLRREHLDDYFSAERVLGRGENAAHSSADELLVDAVGGGERRGESVAEVVGHNVRRGNRVCVKWIKLRGRDVARNANGPTHRPIPSVRR